MRFTAILFFCVLCFYEAKSSSEESLEPSSESIRDYSEDLSDDSGSSDSFELQSTEESEDVSNVSSESVDGSDTVISNEIMENGVIDNEQVYCYWEDIDARDKMATKLGTQVCRFSMVSASGICCN